MKLYKEMSRELLLQLMTKAFVEGWDDVYHGVSPTDIYAVYKTDNGACAAPLSLCSVSAFGLLDPDLNAEYDLREYGKTWVIVDKGENNIVNVLDDVVSMTHSNAIEAEIASLAYMYGEIGNAMRSRDGSAILDGTLYYAEFDGYREGLHKAGNFSIVKTPEEWGLSPEARELGEKIIAEAKLEYEAFEAEYDAWEASWIDGPGN